MCDPNAKPSAGLMTVSYYYIRTDSPSILLSGNRKTNPNRLHVPGPKVRKRESHLSGKKIPDFLSQKLARKTPTLRFRRTYHELLDFRLTVSVPAFLRYRAPGI